MTVAGQGEYYIPNPSPWPITAMASLLLMLGGTALLINSVTWGGWLTLAGFFFKLAVFPFHAWAPAVYQGGPSPVTAFLSVVPKGVALVALFRPGPLQGGSAG